MFLFKQFFYCCFLHMHISFKAVRLTKDFWWGHLMKCCIFDFNKNKMNLLDKKQANEEQP